MLSLERPRVGSSPPIDRRRRHRHLTSWVVVGIGVVVVLVLVIGGLTNLGRASRPYLRSIDRSYAAQASILTRESNQSAAQLPPLLKHAPRMQRDELQAQLAILAQDTQSTSAAADQLSLPSPNQDAAPAFSGAMADRAHAVATIEDAIMGLLGMRPEAVPGAPSTSGASVGAGGSGSGSSTAPATLTQGQAEAQLSAAGAGLARSDRQYAEARHDLRTAAGHPLLPESVWVTSPAQWSAARIDRLVASLAASSSLAPVTEVELIPDGVSVTPTPVPPSPSGSSNGAPAGAAVVPPTTRLKVAAVVVNSGNVSAEDVGVTASVEPLAGGTASSAKTSVSLDPGRSAAAQLPALKVSPGHSYSLVVSLTVPAAQVDRSSVAATSSIWIAPAT